MSNIKRHYKLYLFLLFYFIIWYLNVLIPVIGQSFSDYYMARFIYIMYILIDILSVAIIKNHKENVTKKCLRLSIIFGILSSGLHNIGVGITTFLVLLSSILLLRMHPLKRNIIFYENRKGIIKDILIILLIVIFIYSFNVIPGLLSGTMRLEPNLDIFLKAMIPGISEEVIFRLFFYSIICVFLQGEPSNKHEKFLAYITMMVPHIIAHLPDIFVESGLSGMIVPFFSLLPIVFIITTLFVKKNLVIACGIHFIVDFINFSLVFN